jgi:CRP/FNR family transcriptional regulator, cyclic AMP receptor protein
LADVPAEAARELLKVARRRRFARNEVVFHRDDPGDSLHLVQKGRFAVRVMTPLGDVAAVAVRGPGDAFGEMALLGEGHRRSATVAALEEAETLAVFRTEFEELRRQYAGVDQMLFAFLTAEVQSLNERLLEALYLPVEKRVLRRLLELARLYPAPDGRPLIALTQEAIAELARAQRTTVNLILGEEQRRGSIELLRGKVRLLDIEGIARRAR